MTWPKLSVTLDGPSDPFRCRSCGVEGSLEPPCEDKTLPGSLLPTGLPSLVAWIEHDGDDKPTETVVVLCRKCADRIIEPHPRLYSTVAYWQPHPGIMGLCTSCVHRDGTDCTSPLRLSVGGPGLEILYPQPSQAHVYRRGKGARSGWETIYVGPPHTCKGRETITKGETDA